MGMLMRRLAGNGGGGGDAERTADDFTAEHIP